MEPIPMHFSCESNMLIFSDLLMKDVGIFGKLHHWPEKQPCCLFDELHTCLIHYR